MARSSRPSTPSQAPNEAAELAEAQRLLDALHRLVGGVGEAYVELSGQTAATQAVVADLRRCAAFLHTRLEGEPPPAPWLGAAPSPSAASGPAAGASGPASGFRSPSPSRPETLSGRPPSTPYATIPAPGTPDPPGPSLSPVSAADPVRTVGPQGHASSSRPPLAGRGTPAGGRGATGPGGRGATATPRNPASMPAAGRPSGLRAREPSPQRRGVGPGASASGPTTPGPSGTPLSAATSAPGVHQMELPTHTPSPAPAGPPSHLPLAAQRALSAAAAMAAAGGAGPSASIGSAGAQGQGSAGASAVRPGQPEPAAGPPKPPGVPQLPIALRRAMAQYREALKTRDELLRHQPQTQLQTQRRPGVGDTGAGSGSAAGGGGGPALAGLVTSASRAYCSALQRQFPSSHRGGGGGARGGGTAEALQRLSLGPGGGSASQGPAAAHAATLRRRAQIVFSALVAAQTWLVQSLGELARTRGTGGAAAAAARRAVQADSAAALLADVEKLRAELRSLQQQLAETEARAAAEAEAAAAAAAVAASRSRPSTSSSSRGGLGGGAAGSEAEARAEEALGIDPELAEAAVLWRNRFLRAVLAETAPPPHAAESAAAGALGYGRGVVRRGGAAQPAAARQQQVQRPGADGLPGAPLMPRPLGVWLPDSMWTALPSPAAPPPPGHPAWRLLLPPHASPAVSASATGPPLLLCASAHDAVAHGRAQQQLQAAVFQLVLEGTLAAPLLPRLPPPAVPPQQPAGGARGSGRVGPVEAAWERWLAQCRLAHLLTFKGAWNRQMSVTELAEEEDGEER